jgi:hypothetical protein
MRLHGDFDRLRPSLAALQAHLLVYEPYETLQPVQDGLNL